jgi:hypothetical protein
MATLFRNNIRSEECGTSCFNIQVKIYFPSLHIKLGVTNISAKAIHKESKEFAYLRQNFPKISEANI